MSRRPLILSAFLMNTTSHILGGAWRREDAHQHRFNELQHWVDLVKTLEDGDSISRSSPMSSGSTATMKVAGHHTSVAVYRSPPMTRSCCFQHWRRPPNGSAWP